jgi:mercuric ion transport protein
VELTEVTVERDTVSSQFLIGGVLVSLGASVCCLGPFILLATGMSGAWMSRLMILEPYQPILALIVMSLFAVAGWRIFRPTPISTSTKSCSISQSGKQGKVAFILTAALSAILLTSEYWIPVIDEILMGS